MSEEQKVREERKPDSELRNGKGQLPPTTPQTISVEQIIGSYPIDRERVRDTLLVSISTNLTRIANSLEGMLRLKVARIEEKKVREEVERTTKEEIKP